LDLTHVGDAEVLCRFIFYHRWIRGNGTVKQEAFLPDGTLKLSVTRSITPVQMQIWTVAARVATAHAGRLLGRADVQVAAVLNEDLTVKPAPIADNPMHAHIVGWPVEKHIRKMKAMELANRAIFIRVP
jgi:hypothetical protein